MRDHVANQGGEPRSITLNDALSDEDLAIFTVLGDHLEECTDLVLRRHGCGVTNNCPLIDDADMLMELGAVLVPVPVPGIPLITHLLDYISREIACEAGSINTHKLALACKIGLAATLLHLALPGDEMNLSRRVGKHDTSQLENDGIVAANTSLRRWDLKPDSHLAKTLSSLQRKWWDSLCGTISAWTQHWWSVSSNLKKSGLRPRHSASAVVKSTQNTGCRLGWTTQSRGKPSTP
jgi:hypothetical protein